MLNETWIFSTKEKCEKYRSEQFLPYDLVKNPKVKNGHKFSFCIDLRLFVMRVVIKLLCVLQIIFRYAEAGSIYAEMDMALYVLN